MRLLTYALLPLIALLCACIPPDTSVESVPIHADLTDPEVQRIYELQNQRAADSLLTYLSHPEARLRFLAARAFGSFSDLPVVVTDSLVVMLSDASPEVRTQAAYALGQTRDPQFSAPLTGAFDRTGAYPDLDAALLQAVGRTGDATAVASLASIDTYQAQDTQLLAGRAWGLFYAGLRGFRSAASDRLMIETAVSPDLPDAARYPAAHYLYRVTFPVDTAGESRLRDRLREESDPVIAMGIIRTLGRSGLSPARAALLRYYERSEDWRTKVEVLRAFAGFAYPAVRESVIEALRDPNPLVARTAADYLVDHGIEADAPLYLELAEDELPAEVTMRLYRAANRHLSPFLTDYRDRITGELQRAFGEEDDTYAAARILRALGEYPWMYRTITGYYRDSEVAAVRTAAAEVLQSVSDRGDFDAFFRGSARRVRQELAGTFQDMIGSGEAGPAYHAALALAENPGVYAGAFSDYLWMDESLDAMELPRETETYREVLAARNALTGESREDPAIADGDARPIDWDRFTGAADPVVRLQTTTGTVRMRMWPEAAPATVSSFLELVASGYYDGKAFHRVVPNFVAQGGGPSGDGFGAEDFIVRTETPMLHWDRAGLVGMASAGRDTEGVQFFITHCPTPHLDGNYTIFAEVIEGQEAVDRLVPGSRIERAVIE